ncbi:MAG TPA: CBS domain-containing protein [Candidatus Altiarchaeales archaeon]|nr:CBS domain-containing protein [Candidatus Altiarchaeales archaeon]
MKLNIPRYSDIKGGRDRGPKEFKSKIPEKTGTIVEVMSKDVISVHHTTPLREAAIKMLETDVRRLPVTDAGTGRLEGIIAAVDILDFLGGGEKYNIIGKDYGGNFLSAINCPVSKIMEEIQYLDKTRNVEDAVDIMVKKHRSCIPIVEDEDSLKVIGLVTERDVLPHPRDFNVKVWEVMKPPKYNSSPGMMLSDVAKMMVRNRIRRLPVIREDELEGIVTVIDMLKYLKAGNFKAVDAEENLSTRVETIMQKDVKTVRQNQDLGEVVELIGKTGFGGFPVTKNGRIEGIITITDVLAKEYEK